MNVRNYFFAGYVSELCDFLGYTCFTQVMSNVNKSLEGCRHCVQDCESVHFLSTSTSSRISDTDLEFAK